jgi:glycosyltransferase involved in cell wall biosynthesis
VSALLDLNTASADGKVDTLQVSIVLPCLDEAGAVRACVTEALEALATLGLTGEVVVADNGSTDGSARLALEAGARVVTEPQTGYGLAICSGVRASRGKFVIIADADGSYDLSAIGGIIERLEDGSEVVLGNRFKGEIERGAMPWAHRAIGTPLLSWLIKLFFRTNVGDAMCGLRGITREAFARLALRTTGMEFASEMIARAAREGLQVAEVPVRYRSRIGNSKLRRYRDGWRQVRFLLMYGPTWIYAIPSAILTATGLTLLVTLAVTPIAAFGRQWDMHLAAIASLLTVVGTQIAWLGICARTIAVLLHFTTNDTLITHFYRFFRLETGLLLAGLLLVAGGSIIGVVLWSWASRGFAPLDEIRPLLLAITLIILAFQTAFNVIFLSLLGVRTRDRFGQS